MYLAATIPQAYITNGTRTINMMLIALAAVLVVVSVFLTLLVYRSVMHPIDNMVAACNAKSDEEIGLKINDPSPDELGFLARTIDNMVNEIGLLAQRWSDDQRKMRELECRAEPGISEPPVLQRNRHRPVPVHQRGAHETRR